MTTNSGFCYSMTLSSSEYSNIPAAMKVSYKAPGQLLWSEPLSSQLSSDNGNGTHTFYLCSERPPQLMLNGEDSFYNNSFTTNGAACVNVISCAFPQL